MEYFVFINLPLCGDGGEDAMLISKIIINGYNSFLKVNGRAYMVAECIGNYKTPYLLELMEKLLPVGKLKLSLISRTPVERRCEINASLVSRLRNDTGSYELYKKMWADLYGKESVSFLYFTLFEYVKVSKKELNIFSNYDYWSLKSRLELADECEVISKNMEVSYIQRKNSVPIMISNEVANMIINNCNQTLAELLSTYNANIYGSKVEEILYVFE